MIYGLRDRLGVMRPRRIGRVTDHLQEIIDFVNVLLTKELAYTVNGSVYFDSQKFGSRGDKLNPNRNLDSAETPAETVGYDSGDADKDSLVREKKYPC